MAEAHARAGHRRGVSPRRHLTRAAVPRCRRWRAQGALCDEPRALLVASPQRHYLFGLLSTLRDGPTHTAHRKKNKTPRVGREDGDTLRRWCPRRTRAAIYGRAEVSSGRTPHPSLPPLDQKKTFARRRRYLVPGGDAVRVVLLVACFSLACSLVIGVGLGARCRRVAEGKKSSSCKQRRLAISHLARPVIKPQTG